MKENSNLTSEDTLSSAALSGKTVVCLASSSVFDTKAELYVFPYIILNE